MKNEIDIKNLNNDEIKCLYALQMALKFKLKYLSYGYRDDSVCLSKINGEWCIYFVERGQIFNWQRFTNIYHASLQIIKEFYENEEEKECIVIFWDILCKHEKESDNSEKQIKKLKN